VTGAQRIVSLLPSATDIVFALGLQDRLVGVSHECELPAGIALPALTAARIDSTRTSAEIDAQMADVGQGGHGYYVVHEDRLAELEPDLVLTQDLCEVCAVPLGQVKQAVGKCRVQATVFALNPRTLDDVLDELVRVGDAAGAGGAGRGAAARLRSRIETVRDGAQRARRTAPAPRTVVIEWLEPLMVAGNWTPELVRIAGGRAGLAAAGEHSPWTNWDRIREFSPEVILVAPCGFRLEQTRRELPQLTARDGFAQLPAAVNGQCFSIDGNTYFNRPGPLLVDSLEIVAGCLWPQVFPQFASHVGVERFGV